MIPRLVSLITALAATTLIARGLGPSGLGVYALVSTVSTFTLSLSDLGIAQTAIRYASRAASLGDSETQFAVLRWGFAWRMALVVSVIAIVFVLAPVLANDIWHVQGLTVLVRIALLVAAFGALSSIPTIYFQSIHRFGMNAAVLSGQALVSFAGLLLLAWQNRWTVTSVITVNLISSALGAVAFLTLVPKGAILPTNASTGSLRSVVHSYLKNPVMTSNPSLVMGDVAPNTFALFSMVSTVLTVVIQRSDIWLMGVFLDQSDIGIYNAAMRFALPLQILFAGLNTALWPRASALTQPHATVALLRKVFRYSMVAAAGGVLYGITVPWLTPLVLGHEYTGSVLIGQILCVHYVLAILINPMAIVGYNFGLVRWYWVMNLVQLVMFAVLNVSWLPVYGPLGAALAWVGIDLLGMVVVGSLLVWKIRRLGQKPA